MEPAIPGPIRYAECWNCQLRFGFSESSIREDFPVQCRTCKQPIQWQDEIESPQAMSMEKIRDDGPIHIGDVVAFRESSNQSLEVKRVAGLDHQSVELRLGDLWIDGRRWQKNLEQFLRMALLVDVLPVDVVQSITTSHRIGKDFWLNHGERVGSETVGDFGILFPRWDRPMVSPCRIELQYRDQKIEMQFDPLSPSAVRCTIIYQEETRSEYELEIRDGSWFAMACVDGRWLFGSTDASHVIAEVSGDPEKSEKTETNLSDSARVHERTDQQLQCRWIGFEGLATEAWLIRDLYLETPGKAETRFEPFEGLILLGDNVQLSQDSRQRSWDRMPKSHLMYRIIDPVEPLSNLQRQRRLFLSTSTTGEGALIK